MLKIGQVVHYVDRHGIEWDALITAVWDGRQYWWKDGGEQTAYSTLPHPEKATINLVVVSENEDQHDQYGRQTQHETSVPHQTNTTSPGYYWF